MSRLCLDLDFELTIKTVIGIFLFVFVLDNQRNINLEMILGDINKFMLFFNRCDTDIAVMQENALSHSHHLLFF